MAQMDFASRSVLILIFLQLTGLAAAPRPLPPPETRQREGSLTSAITRMRVSHPYRARNPEVIPNSDIIGDEVDMMRRFIDNCGVPNDRKKIVYVRYELGDRRVTNLLLHAKNQNVKTQIVTDFNVCMNGTFAEGQTTTTDFRETNLRTDPMSQAIRALLAAGYTFNGDDYGITSQPIYRHEGDSQIPIQHEKEFYCVVLDDRGAPASIYKSGDGTANASTNSEAIVNADGEVTTYRPNRYNRHFEINNVGGKNSAGNEIGLAGLAHAQAMIDTFRNANPAARKISDIRARDPFEIQFRGDGSRYQLAFTDGKFNPNQRIADLLNQAATDPMRFPVREVIFSEFVLTNRDVTNALKAAMQAQTDFRVWGIFDNQFVDLRGFGLAAEINGFDVFRPFGGTVHGFGRALTSRVDFFVYQRGLEGIPGATSVGGRPSTHLWHDKTTVIKAEIDRQNWDYIFTGSLNNSGHFQNAERQEMMVVPADSWIGRGTEDSIKTAVASEPQWAIPMITGVLRNGVANFIGHRELELPLENIRRIEQGIREGNLEGIATEIRALARARTTIARPVPIDEVNNRIERIGAFLTWYRTLAEFRTLEVQKVAAIGTLLSYPSMSPQQRRDALNAALWHPGISDTDLEDRIARGWDLLGLGPLPPRPAPRR